MVRVQVYLFIILSLFSHLLFPKLIDYYKKGVIKLEPDPNFGKNNDWISLFYDPNKNISIAPNGNIFVSNRLQHNIYKFSNTGELIKKMGQIGQGPTDLLFPRASVDT
ncbi:MAG: hypothetical protein ACM3SY_10515 [Candidatus Omnitrophota bacterium]